MKILKKVSIPTAPKAKRNQWEKIVKKHLEKSLQKRYFGTTNENDRPTT